MARSILKVNVSKTELGKRIQEVRKSRGLTQKEVAEQLATSQSNISDIERGTRKPTLRQVAQLSLALKVSLDELLLNGKQPADYTFVKDRRFLRRLQRIDRLSKREKENLLGTIDAFLKSAEVE